MRALEARPCTIAERGPEARIVGNDMPSRPGTTRLIFHGGGNFNFRHARPNFLARNLKQTGATAHGSPDAQNLGSILHHAGAFDQRRRGAQARLPFQRSGQPVAHAGSDRFRFDAQMDADACVKLRRCAASHSAAASSGDFARDDNRAAPLHFSFAWVR